MEQMKKAIKENPTKFQYLRCFVNEHDRTLFIEKCVELYLQSEESQNQHLISGYIQIRVWRDIMQSISHLLEDTYALCRPCPNMKSYWTKYVTIVEEYGPPLEYGIRYLLFTPGKLELCNALDVTPVPRIVFLNNNNKYKEKIE